MINSNKSVSIFIFFLILPLNILVAQHNLDEYLNFNITESWNNTSQRWLEYIVTHQYNFKPEEIEAAKHELALRSENVNISEDVLPIITEYIERNPDYKNELTGDVFIRIGVARGISFRQMVTQDEIYETALKYDVEPEVIVLYNSIKNRIYELYGEPKRITSIDLKNYITRIENNRRWTEIIIYKNLQLIYDNDVQIIIYSDKYYIDDGYIVEIYDTEDNLTARNIREFSDENYDLAIDTITRRLNLNNIVWQKTFSIAGVPMLKGGGLLAWYHTTADSRTEYWLIASEDGFNEIVRLY